jgi:hypothetical protein
MHFFMAHDKKKVVFYGPRKKKLFFMVRGKKSLATTDLIDLWNINGTDRFQL